MNLRSKEKALEQSKAHEEVLAPEQQKDPIAKEKTDDDSRSSGRKNKKISMILMKMKSKKRNLAKEVENVELKNLLVKTF